MSENNENSYRELRNGETPFAVATALADKAAEPVPAVRGRFMSSFDLAKQTGSAFPFGLDKTMLAEYLRELARRVENSEILPQQAETISSTQINDYPMTIFNFTFFEKRIK